MWNHMGYGMGWAMVLWTGIVVWFVIFSVLVVNKLNRVIQLLERK